MLTEVNKNVDLGNIICINTIDVIPSSNITPMCMDINSEGKFLSFEVDTGSYASVWNEGELRIFFKNKVIEKTNKNFSVVTGDDVDVFGVAKLKMYSKNVEQFLELYVIRTDRKFMPLLGRQWLDVLVP